MTVVGCNSIQLPGVSVALILSGVTVATGTTTGKVTSMATPTAGSGYTPGTIPNVVISGGGGSGATAVAVMNAAGTGVAAVFITGYGSGYTSAPTVAIDPPVSGVTATVVASITIFACLPYTTVGTYTLQATDPTGRFNVGTLSRNLICGTQNFTITLTAATGYVCFQCTAGTCAWPIKTTLNFTVPGGSGSSTSSSIWTLPVTYSGVLVCTTPFNQVTGSITFTHEVINGSGQPCYGAAVRGQCETGGGGTTGTGCTFADDSYVGGVGPTSSGCISSTGFAFTCYVPGVSAFSISFTNFTYYSNPALTTTYWSGAVTITE